MSIIERLSSEKLWNEFYNHKIAQGNMRENESEDLRRFIDSREYLAPYEEIKNGGFRIPEKILVNKTSSRKKRIVYKFPREENYVLKFIAYQLRDYDEIFTPNLFSFRKNISVKSAVNSIKCKQYTGNMFVYKTDISDYFKSVDIFLLLPMLGSVFADDADLYKFFKTVLENKDAIYQGKVISEEKGIIPGAPISSFLANLFLGEMDKYFFDRNILYMRYSDDIIVFADTMQELEEYISIIKNFVYQKGLTINPDKEEIFPPNTPWIFLGFEFRGNTVDISSVSIKKLKAKMKRKTKALKYWADSKGLPGSAAARAFIKRFNAKLFCNPIHNELTWARWFFPVINTDEGLREIDRYELECIRYLVTGKRTKGRFECRYEDIKKLGYKNLVNEYYKNND